MMRDIITLWRRENRNSEMKSRNSRKNIFKLETPRNKTPRKVSYRYRRGCWRNTHKRNRNPRKTPPIWDRGYYEWVQGMTNRHTI